MIIYVVRHAEAGDAVTDAKRALTPRGRRRSRDVARAMKKLKCSPHAVIASPLKRAAETAEIMAGYLNPELKVSLSDMLEPGADPAQAADWACSRKAEEIMLVGHMPGLSRLASMLLCANAGLAMDFSKSGVCRISFTERAEPGLGILDWLMKPAHLELIAR